MFIVIRWLVLTVCVGGYSAFLSQDISLKTVSMLTSMPSRYVNMIPMPCWLKSRTRNMAAFINSKHQFSSLNSNLNNHQSIDTDYIADDDDTIYALSSGSMAKCGVSVIRLSGKFSKYCLERLLVNPSAQTDGVPKFPFPLPRAATLRKLYSPISGDILDSALVLWFPGPKSFTGNDVVEFHVHGSRAVIIGLFDAFEYLDNEIKGQGQNKGGGGGGGIRPAERGEFTRNAFENGKMDLTEVEGLADLLEAETSEQRKQALRQMDGHIRITFESWREGLIHALAHTEAVIDFGDDDRESDINDDAMWALIPKIEKIKSEIVVHLKDGKKGELVREGIRIALAGPPNAGKSSLMNALARRPAAIVSPIAGTTRDIVEVRMDLGGVPCIISDTAGLRSSTSDPIEREGIKRAKEAFQQAQLKIFVKDSSDILSSQVADQLLFDLLNSNEEITSSNRVNELDDSLQLQDSPIEDKVVLVLNKADLVKDIKNTLAHNIDNENISQQDITKISVSCLTGEGIAALEAHITTCIQSLLALQSAEGSGVLITRERHRRHLQQCLQHLNNFLDRDLPMDLAAEELRLAMRELGKVTGRVDVEELLDVIFRDFCIGK